MNPIGPAFATPGVVPTVAFDAVGPSSAGTSSNASPLAWSHTVSGTNTLLLAGVTTGFATTPTSVTYGVQTMTLVTALTCGAGSNSLFVYKLTGATPGTATVTVTDVAEGALIVGGSVSFNGVSQTTGIGTVYTTNTTGTSALSVSTIAGSNTNGNIIAGFAGTGQPMVTPSGAFAPGNNVVVNNVIASFASGNFAIQTTPATGNPVTVGENILFTTPFYGIIAFEILSLGQ